jgi:hypothetical protein
MDAPVYRHAESRATLLGLHFPTDFFVVVVTGYGWLLLLRPLPSLLAVAATHLCLVLLNHDRPPQRWPHWIGFQSRQILHGGQLGAAARSRAPQFPHAPLRARPWVLLPRA